MMQCVLDGTLKPCYREAGIHLIEDEDIISLVYEGKTVAQFNSSRVTVERIQDVAKEIYQELKGC